MVEPNFEPNERRRRMLHLVFELGQLAKRVHPVFGPGFLVSKDVRRFRLALCVLGEPIPTWAKRK